MERTKQFNVRLPVKVISDIKSTAVMRGIRDSDVMRDLVGFSLPWYKYYAALDAQKRSELFDLLGETVKKFVSRTK